MYIIWGNFHHLSSINISLEYANSSKFLSTVASPHAGITVKHLTDLMAPLLGRKLLVLGPQDLGCLAQEDQLPFITSTDAPLDHGSAQEDCLQINRNLCVGA